MNKKKKKQISIILSFFDSTHRKSKRIYRQIIKINETQTKNIDIRST